MILLSLAPEASASANFATTACYLFILTSFSDVVKRFFYFFGAEDRNRTGTVVSNRGILSPVRLPVSPPRQEESSKMERVMGIEPT